MHHNYSDKVDLNFIKSELEASEEKNYNFLTVFITFLGVKTVGHFEEKLGSSCEKVQKVKNIGVFFHENRGFLQVL